MIAQFAVRLIVGMSLMWAVMPRREVTSGFFRIQMLVTLALGVLAGLTIGQFTGDDAATSLLKDGVAQGLCYAIAGVSFLGSVLWTLERRGGGTVLAFAILGMALVVLLGIAGVREESTGAVVGLIFAGELATAAMVGGFLTTMLLGHWYLTAPTMTIRPLSRLNLFLGVCTAGRCAVSIAAILVMHFSLRSIDGQTQWMWLALRWGAGIIGPAVLVLMVFRILEFRNTQSATGVLFVGVILTFIGELSATLLARLHGLPL